MKKLVLALSLCATSILLAQQTQKAEALDSVMITTKINIPKKNKSALNSAIPNDQNGPTVAGIIITKMSI